MIRFSISYVLREIQIKTMIHHWVPISMAKSETLTTLNAGKDAEQQELSYIIGGNAKMVQWLRNIVCLNLLLA